MPCYILRQIRARLRSEEAVQLIEFAVILPLMMVIIVGIFDFSEAFNLKQKLANAAFEGARLGSSQPTTDLSQALPVTVSMIRDAVDTYLQRAEISDCGLGSITATATPLMWTATGSCAGGTTLTLTIQRGYTLQATVSGVPSKVNVVATLVTIKYPYQWQFNRVISLLAAGANYTPAFIQVTSKLPNQD